MRGAMNAEPAAVSPPEVLRAGSATSGTAMGRVIGGMAWEPPLSRSEGPNNAAPGPRGEEVHAGHAAALGAARHL